MGWLRTQVTYVGMVRAAATACFFYLALFRAEPNDTVLILLVGLIGLPHFIQLDRKSQGDKE